MGAACSPDALGDKCANARRMKPRALEYLYSTVLGHISQNKVGGKVCQCMGLPHALAYCSPTVLGHIGVWFDSQGQPKTIFSIGIKCAPTCKLLNEETSF